MQLFFYDVNVDYVNYLKKAEINKRGFTKVPDIEYKNKKKMLCGIVLQINEYKYYVPISSYKKQQNNNILIKLKADTYNQIKGSLRFNYMFPVPDKYVTKCNFNKSNTAGRKEFLRRQWVYCNTIADDITKMAYETYYAVIQRKDKNLKKSSCDFKLLEAALNAYEESDFN